MIFIISFYNLCVSVPNIFKLPNTWNVLCEPGFDVPYTVFANLFKDPQRGPAYAKPCLTKKAPIECLTLLTYVVIANLDFNVRYNNYCNKYFFTFNERSSIINIKIIP